MTMLTRTLAIVGAAAVAGGATLGALHLAHPIFTWNEFAIAGAMPMVAIMAMTAAAIAATVCDAIEGGRQ